MSRRPALTIAVFGALAAAAVLLRLAATRGGLAWPADAFEWELRGLRVSSGLAVGAALAAAGVLLQSLLRNPLAAPSLLGLNAGGALGVVISIVVGYYATGAIVQYQPPALAAVAGSLAALAVVYGLAQRRGFLEPVSLILIGVVIAMICAAATMLLLHLLPDRGLAVTMRWMQGSLSDDVGWERIALIGGVTLAGIVLGAWLGPAMDAAALGDDEARSVGLPLDALRVVLFIGAGLLTAGTVLLAGPIGFVGLVCPHAVRLIGGPAHRPLVIGAALAGGAMIVGADALVRIVDFGAGRMPIGVLTALVGGPAFLWLLRRQGLSS